MKLRVMTKTRAYHSGESMPSPGKRPGYLWDYYKLPIIIGLIIIYIVGYATYRYAGKKETLLYTALVNVAPGEEFCRILSDGFLESLEADPKKMACLLYKGLYLTDDEADEHFSYTYASQMKILASIEDEQLDIVLLNREAFDAFAQNGYLYDLRSFFSDPTLEKDLLSCYVEGTEILEDNAKEVSLDDTLEYQAVTRQYPMALDVSGFALFQNAGFRDTVYLGVLANTPRKEMADQYIRYLYRE